MQMRMIRIRICLTSAKGESRSRSKRFLYVFLGLCLSMTLPCLYPLSILCVHLIYPLHERMPMEWVIPLFSFLIVATKSN
jgi:hypothetical protein